MYMAKNANIHTATKDTNTRTIATTITKVMNIHMIVNMNINRNKNLLK